MDSENFLYFHEEPSVDNEFERFICDRRENKEMLLDYPSVLKLFIKFNNPIPSSAPVERLFSIGALVLTKKRNKLKDLLFEHLLMLKINEID